MGPVLRAAFPEMRITQARRCSVFRLRVVAGEGLVNLTRLVEARGLVLESVHLLRERVSSGMDAAARHGRRCDVGGPTSRP
jgi:hypothetical protein